MNAIFDWVWPDHPISALNGTARLLAVSLATLVVGAVLIALAVSAVMTIGSLL